MDIQIDIKDDRHFTDVASIVDREDFAKEVERIRSVLKIKIPLSDDELLKFSSIDKEKIIKNEIEKSRQRLYLPIVFSSVIISVVFRNEVTNKDYVPAYLVCKWAGESFNDEGTTPDETYSIVISPWARDEDVLKTLQEYRDQLGNFKGVPNYKYIHRVYDVNIKKPSIRKHRKWYLEAKSGKSPENICDSETKNCPLPIPHNTGKGKSKQCTCYDLKAIKDGISAFKTLIWRTRTS